MTTLNAAFDPFVGTLTTNNMHSCTSPQWLRIFSTMLAQKYKIWRLKLPKWTKYLSNTDRIAFSGASGSMEEDFFTKSQSWKKGSPDQRSRCRTCAEACHSPFKYDCTSKDQPHQILRHLKHILKVFFFKMYVQKCIVMRFLHLKVAVHSLKLGCGSLFIGTLFKTCCRYKAQIWHRKNMFISHHIF